MAHNYVQFDTDSKTKCLLNLSENSDEASELPPNIPLRTYIDEIETLIPELENHQINCADENDNPKLVNMGNAQSTNSTENNENYSEIFPYCPDSEKCEYITSTVKKSRKRVENTQKSSNSSICEEIIQEQEIVREIVSDEEEEIDNNDISTDLDETVEWAKYLLLRREEENPPVPIRRESLPSFRAQNQTAMSAPMKPLPPVPEAESLSFSESDHKEDDAFSENDYSDQEYEEDDEAYASENENQYVEGNVSEESIEIMDFSFDSLYEDSDSDNRTELHSSGSSINSNSNEVSSVDLGEDIQGTANEGENMENNYENGELNLLLLAELANAQRYNVIEHPPIPVLEEEEEESDQEYEDEYETDEAYASEESYEGYEGSESQESLEMTDMSSDDSFYESDFDNRDEPVSSLQENSSEDSYSDLEEEQQATESEEGNEENDTDDRRRNVPLFEYLNAPHAALESDSFSDSDVEEEEEVSEYEANDLEYEADDEDYVSEEDESSGWDEGIEITDASSDDSDCENRHSVQRNSNKDLHVDFDLD